MNQRNQPNMASRLSLAGALLALAGSALTPLEAQSPAASRPTVSAPTANAGTKPEQKPMSTPAQIRTATFATG